MAKNLKPITYPEAPKKPIPKPVFMPGKKPKAPPKESLWGVHDPAIFHDKESGYYYIYCTGANAHRSKDMIVWESLGRVVEQPPQESLDWVGGDAIWAPDIVKVGKEYRLYCSSSTFGVRQSCIFLAVSDSPEGPFKPSGCVLKTHHNSPVNAIDANIISDVTTGEQYMVYGSFWGGCHLLKLDKKTGLAAEDGIGICLARRPGWTDSAIEGPYIQYNEETGYYYLFVSYASLNSDYNIRVGRSKTLTGPYYDHNGRNMTDLEDFQNNLGYMIACGYHFNKGTRWMGPGHNSVLKDFDNEWYLICHIREQQFKHPELSTMHVHKLLWTQDGWPVANPECYAGEKTGSVTKEQLIGSYERIKLTPSIPQGTLNSVPMDLLEDGSLKMGSIAGHWEFPGDTTLALYYANIVETCQITPAWDWERNKPTLALTGKDQMGICIWAKKV